MVQLVAKHRQAAPELLYMLQAVIKVEELDLPLRRNQDYVMKYFTQVKSEVAEILEVPTVQERYIFV